MAGLYIFVVVGLLIPWVSCETIDPALEVDIYVSSNSIVVLNLVASELVLWKNVEGKTLGSRTVLCDLSKSRTWSRPPLQLVEYLHWKTKLYSVCSYYRFRYVSGVLASPTSALVGFLQFAIQTIVSLTFIYWWVCEDTEEPDTLMQQTFKVVTVLCVLVSIPATLMYTAVISFHLYLNHVNLGTYEWMLERRKRAREQRQANRTVELASHLSETQTASV